MNHYLTQAYANLKYENKMKATIRPQNNLNTTEFKELKFQPHPTGIGKVNAYVQFDNGYGASIVKGEHTYGGRAPLLFLSFFFQPF